MNSVHNICQTCLSDGRQLYPLEVIRNLLPELERYIEEIKESIGGVCWECRSHILKFFKFKAKVRKAQNTMWDLKVNKQNGNLSSVSTLSVTHKQTYDHIYTFNEEMKIKTEPIFIKQEADISDCEMDDPKTDIDINEPINFEFVNTVKQENVQSDDGNIIVPKLEILDNIEITYSDGENDEKTKFSKVIFTEEEMQACREIKRSQPNFKALPLKCCDCVLGFKMKDQYDLHMKKHDLKAGSFLCDICMIRFPSDFELAQHRHKHYKGYKCKVCHYKSTLCNVIRAHCSSQHKVDTVNKIRSNVIVDSVTSSPLTQAPKKSKTQAERQREYRLRQKQKILNNAMEKKKTSPNKIEYQRQYRLKKRLKKAQNKLPKKTRADYQREYRIRKKLRTELNSGYAGMIPSQEAGPSWYLPPVTTAPLTPSSPDAVSTIMQHEAVIETVELLAAKLKKKAQEQHDNISEVRKLKSVQQYPTGDHIVDEICQLPSQAIQTSHLADNGMQQISNQHVENFEFNELKQPQDFYDSGERLPPAIKVKDENIEKNDSSHTYIGYSP